MTRGRWHVVAVLVGIVAVLAAVGASAEAGYGRTDGTSATATVGSGWSTPAPGSSPRTERSTSRG